MVYKARHKLAVDTEKKKELLRQLPEPARDVLLHMPTQIEPDRFIDHIILTEKLIKASGKREDGTGHIASIISIGLLAFSLLLMLTSGSYIAVAAGIMVLGILVLLFQRHVLGMNHKDTIKRSARHHFIDVLGMACYYIGLRFRAVPSPSPRNMDVDRNSHSISAKLHDILTPMKMVLIRRLWKTWRIINAR